MVTYCYKTPGGEIVERMAPMGQAPRFLVVHGKRAKRCLQAEMADPIGTKKVHCRASMALGVNPRQVPELQRLLKSRGCRPTQFDAQGDCLVQDQRHANEIMRARGMRNQDGGFGDYCGK